MAAASFKESGSDHMWIVFFFFDGVVRPHLLITYSCKCIKPDRVFILFFQKDRNYRLSLSSRRFFLLLTSVSKYTESVQYTIYLIKNSQAVKKGAAPKKAMVKKDVKSKVAAKKWL